MKKRKSYVDKGEWFSRRNRFVFILLVASSSGSAGYTNDLCNGQQVYGVSARRAGQTSLRLATRCCGRGGRCPESTSDQWQSRGYNVADRLQRNGRRRQLRSDSSPGCWGAAGPAALTVPQ